MTETPDPRAALEAKDLPTQAAGARDLALVGTWSDLEPLLELASTARSTGLRLVSGAALADIVHRYRTGRASPPPGAQEQADLIERIKRLDPSINPNVLMVLAAFPERRVIERLGRLLRDPRNTVRLGAAVSLRRMALSHTDLDLPELRGALADWVRDPRLPPDSHAEVLRLIGDLGVFELSDAAQTARCSTQSESDARDLTLRLLQQRKEPATWNGVWLSDGRDVLEPGQPSQEISVLLIYRGQASIDFGKAVGFSTDKGRGRCDSALDGLRWIRAPRLGHPEPLPALQIQGRTWFHAVVPTELIDFMRTCADRFSTDPGPVRAILPALLEQAEGTAARRALPLARLLAGDLDQAHTALSSAVKAKRPRSEDILWLARADELLGHTSKAVQGYRAFLEKSGRKPWGTRLATERLAALTPEDT